MERVDFNALLDDKEYDIRPGIEYQISETTIARLGAPTENRIEKFDNLVEQFRSGDDVSRKEMREQTYKQAAAVLTVIDGSDDFEDKKGNLIYPVVERAVSDFFFLKSARPSKQMKSFLEENGQFEEVERKVNPDKNR